ncbi:MAG TPA: acetyl-CoA hydrolase/transferase C-terminal domain-containing protein [Povalibacter sp.]|uniref:acetyl-CoA hydrolase/transferase C-terminal domain-containing protein n=1 Tax=Povalibacter sp. TaxID=1962978 RepID=UPI002BDD5DDA|nr:acetyl-CoA hydrolase/transferase C-terminal domain-containing protein [Povalibacter sp.]HMN45466.1 acetyl-CoA hydrolase/transferase C-terminal domain-containing protein [Povalibacter sp.]
MNPVRFTQPDDCVEATLSRVGRHIVMGLPVAIGKPNPLVNAFVRRAVGDPGIRLTIVTALSLRVPRWHGDLERRLLQPLTQRIFGNTPELEYVRLIEQGRLPPNIEVIEFYLEPGAWLGNEHLQRHYLSSNYTHVARDALRRGMNVVAQIVAAPPADEMPAGVLSLGSNPDLTADLLPQIASMRASGQPFALIGQVHRELPFMYGDALVASDTFDFLVEDPAADYPLFAPPNLPIGLTEHVIALHVSTLLRDGGTLQLGIGELGDAIVYATQLRHRQPAVYREVLESTGILEKHRRLIETEGGTAPFERGLYGCSEMLVDGFLDLYRSGILRRRVYPSARIQRLLDEGHIDETVSRRTLDALSAAGMNRMSYVDFNELREVGVFRDDVQYERGMLIAPDGALLPAGFDDPAHRESIARQCLGERLRNGVLVDAGFFFGPKAFYAGLRELPAEQRRLFAMRGISFVNELYGHEWELKTAQRRHARFVNTTMMVTGLGAAVSDALEDGRVVSGVGGQYNFVAMAHALAEARSILCLRSTRVSKGKVTSNIVWNYGHTTIPRHLRDIVVTEYGIADLRGRTDEEIVQALVAVMDARFQDDFVAAAHRAKKLPADYRIPAQARDNRPDILAARFARWRDAGLFASLPYGSDFTGEERVLMKALKGLAAQAATWAGRLRIATAMLASPDVPEFRPLLERMALAAPSSFRERIGRRLVAAALRLDGSLL